MVYIKMKLPRSTWDNPKFLYKTIIESQIFSFCFTPHASASVFNAEGDLLSLVRPRLF